MQAAINAAQTYLPARPADAADLQQGQPGGCADPDPRAHLEDHAPLRRSRITPTPGWRRRSPSCPASARSRISGGQKPAVRVQVNPTQLAAYGLNLEDVRTALAAASLDRQGQLRRPAPELPDRRQRPADSRATRLQDAGLAYQNGAPVMLKDVAEVVDGVENTEQAAWMNRTPAVIVNIQRQPGANIIEVVDRIKALLPKLRATIPPAIDIAVLTDRTMTVRASVADVEFELCSASRWSSWSSSSSCAISPRPSSRASRCRSRSSAPSR